MMRASRRNGFALMVTLWLSIAIASVALGFALEARAVRRSTINLGESTQALAAARAGVATTLARLNYLRVNNTLPPGATPAMSVRINADDPWASADSALSQRVDLGGGAGYTVVVRDVGAQLDINQASATEWQNFLTGLQFDAGLASRLSQEIVDWRDPDDFVQAEGAERDEYVRAGRVTLPANRSFESIDQLRDVLDMTPAVYDSIAPYLTVLGGLGQVSINTAPSALLHSIPQFTDDVVAAILSRRSMGGRFASLEELMAQVGGASQARLTQHQAFISSKITFTTQAVNIISTGWAPGGRTKVTSTVRANAGPNPQLATTIQRREQ